MAHVIGVKCNNAFLMNTFITKRITKVNKIWLLPLSLNEGRETQTGSGMGHAAHAV